MTSSAILVSLVMMLAGIAVLLGSASVFRHASIFFSVRVPGDFPASNRAHAIVRGYRISLGAFAAIAACLTCVGVAYRRPVLLALAPLVLVSGGISAFLIARRAVLPSAAPQTGVAEAATGRSAPIRGGWLAIAGPFLLLVAAAAWMAAHRQAVPARFPVHWGSSGRPDRFGSPGWRSLFGPTILGFEICALLSALVFGIARRAPSGPEGSVRYKHAILRLLIGVMWMMAVLFSYITLGPLYGTLPVAVFVPLLVIAIAALIIPLARISSGPEADSETTPDDCWTGGMFYFNRRDPALFVQKRFGIGYTFNFAHPVAWAALALTLLIPITALILL